MPHQPSNAVAEIEHSRVRRRWPRVAIAAACAAVAMFAGGFVIFVNGLPPARTGTPETADGIVVLTGGALRIEDALELMAQGSAKRLLISGVNVRTTRGSLRRRFAAYAAVFDCCVDLDHRAKDTAGNADEAAGWARRNGFASLILVTSSYHMPRSLLELRHALPDVKVTAYPVWPPNLYPERWWNDTATFRLLGREYVKYLAAHAKTWMVGRNGRHLLAR